MQIDFTPLSDDQLVTLIRSACQEAARRGDVVTAAVQDAMLTEAERVTIRREAAAREAERLRSEQERRIAADAAEAVRRQAEQRGATSEATFAREDWERKKLLARMVLAALGAGWRLSVWQKDGEKRVYLDRGDRYDPTGRVEYYLTGNNRYAPKTFSSEWGKKGAERYHIRALTQIAQFACEHWSELQLQCNGITERADIADLPLPEKWERAMQEIREGDATALTAKYGGTPVLRATVRTREKYAYFGPLEPGQAWGRREAVTDEERAKLAQKTYSLLISRSVSDPAHAKIRNLWLSGSGSRKNPHELVIGSEDLVPMGPPAEWPAEVREALGAAVMEELARLADLPRVAEPTTANVSSSASQSNPFDLLRRDMETLEVPNA